MRLRDWLVDDQHPLRSPALGRLISAVVCSLGHRVVVMEMDTWEEDWLACQVCGARFFPASVLDDETEVIAI